MKDWVLGPIGKGDNGLTVSVRSGAFVGLVSQDDERYALSPHEARMLGKALTDAAGVAELRQKAKAGDEAAKLIVEAEED